MINIKASVTDTILSLPMTLIQQYQVNTAEIEFTFDESWNEYSKYVTFKNDDKVTKVSIFDNKCVIPTSLDTGIIYIQVYGQKLENDTIIERQPTNIKTIRILNSINPNEDETTENIETTEWDKFVQEITSMKETDEILNNNIQANVESIKEIHTTDQELENKIQTNAEAIEQINTSLGSTIMIEEEEEIDE